MNPDACYFEQKFTNIYEQTRIINISHSVMFLQPTATSLTVYFR